MQNIKLNFRLAPHQYEKVRLFARELGLKPTDVIKNMVENARIESRPLVATSLQKENANAELYQSQGACVN